MTTSTATLMQEAAVESAARPEGLLLLNSILKPIFINPAAVQILVYPQKGETCQDLDQYLESKIRSSLVSGFSPHAPALVSEFQSGRRLYLCRSFPVHALTQASSQPLLGVLLEGGSKRSISLDQVSEKFHLSTREQEVLQHLLDAGLTTKEIAVRMRISPNTVKVFLRLIMVKMGVSTRSGIVGKAFATEL